MSSADWRGYSHPRLGSSCKRLVLIGAECTGKSTLAQALARSLAGVYVAEYLRTFVTVFGRLPRATDSAYLIASQQALRNKAIAGRSEGWIIEDTDEWSTAIYHRYYFGGPLDVEPFGAQLPDAYILCRPDFPWEPDGDLRDGPRVRAELDKHFDQHVRGSGIPYLVASGQLSSRLAAVHRWLKNQEAAQQC